MATKKTATRKTPAKKAAVNKTATKSSAGRQTKPGLDIVGAPGKIADSITESTRNIWLAGIGALGRAQIEGSKLFESLVTEGANLENNARHYVDDKVESTVGIVNEQVKDARTRAGKTWNTLEAAFEDRVQRTLTKLGIPSRAEVDALHAKVNALSARTARPAAKKSPAKATKRTAQAPSPPAPVPPTID